MQAYRVQRWYHWLRAAGLPAAHIAIVLDLEPSELDSILSLPPPPNPVIPRRCPGQKKILGQTASKVRELMSLGYSSGAIAHYLALPLEDVADFVHRATPQRRGALVRPRSRPEQRRVNMTLDRRDARRNRRNAPNSQRNAWTVDDWQYKDDVGPDGLVTALPVALATEEIDACPAAPGPPPAAALTAGSAWVDEPIQRRPKLSADEVATLRARLLDGATWAQISRDCGVAENTLRRMIGDVGRRKIMRPLPTEASKIGGCLIRWDEPLGYKHGHRTVLVTCQCGHTRHVSVTIILGTSRCRGAAFTGLCRACLKRSNRGRSRGRTVQFGLSEPDEPRGAR